MLQAKVKKKRKKEESLKDMDLDLVERRLFNKMIQSPLRQNVSDLILVINVYFLRSTFLLFVFTPNKRKRKKNLSF